MRLKSLFLLFGLILCTTFLANCSRESSIKENVNLRNNHSVVFVYKTPFENPDAFADSITNLPNPDSVIVSDTVTVTIGDTVHMMGFLRYNADKIYLYQWILDSLVKDSTGKGKDQMKKVLVTGHNATPQSWVYMKEGIYSPLFVAVDGNSATDTAGKDQFIRVINTPPYLGVPKDTLWTRARSSVTFPVLASDSFGTITSFKVNLDADGKHEAKGWKYTKSELSDSLEVTIPYDSTLTDSLGNQKLYIVVTDDDNNATRDSVILHFNQLPTLKILGPDDQQRISDTVESFRLFYEGHDKDNEDQLRYYVRVAATPDNQDDDLNLSNVYDLVLKNSTSTSFSVIEDGENALKKLGFTGRYFSWDVWVTDGYDTVVAEKIKTKKGKRPRFFYLGPSKSTCDFTGLAKFEGLSNHSKIKITLINLADTSNIYTTTTNAKGEFKASELPAGTYRLIASDESGRGFKTVTTKTPTINAGDERELPLILLNDPAPPSIFNIKGATDTITARTFTISGKFSDYGSQVKTAIAVFNKDTCDTKSQSCKFTEKSNHAWSVELTSIPDGNYNFSITAIDSAGYSSDTTISFVVSATKISLDVNGNTSDMAAKDRSLTFTAKIETANPPIKKVYWQYKHKDSTNFVTVDSSSVSGDKATIELYANKFKKPSIKFGDRYDMRAVSSNGSVSNVVRFVFIERGPMVNFDAPSTNTIITPNDTITVKASVLGNNPDGTNTYKSLTWNCLVGGKPSSNCLSGTDLEQKISWTKPDTVNIILTVTNDSNETATDTLRIYVIADPPSITIDENEGIITKKVRSSHKIEVTAKDKYGKIEGLAWKCANDASYTPVPIAKPDSIITDSITITNLPGEEMSKYRCIVRATDDDGQYGYDTLFFKLVTDIPTIRLNIHSKNVTILDKETIKYTVSNLLGGPVNVQKACAPVLKNATTWEDITGNVGEQTYYPVSIPDTPGKYYCIVRATDADAPGTYTMDTVSYSVFLAPPTVTLNESYTRTINDTLTLYANAKDSSEATLPGRIDNYEWGCGANDDDDILGKLISTGKNTYTVTLPATPQDNYLCIVQATDDDGLSARDTTRFTVELAPPNVKVARDSGVIREGFDIVLSATASDTYEGTWGYIAKREWSCGANDADIGNNWKVVSSFDTTWTAPTASVNFYCIARATDDDGNIATDTMTLAYSTDAPIISVAETHVNVPQGVYFLLDASINNVWQGITWYSWQCFYADDNSEAEPLVKLDYYKNGERFYDYRQTLSEAGRDLYCVVSAEEKSTKAVFRDTTHVKVLTIERDLPVGKITAADTIYPWSGDDLQTGEALYFYSPEWGGQNSEIGTLGDVNNRDFYWNFSNAGAGFFRAEQDGSIDMNKTQYFNDAFRRPSTDTSFSVCLDFRDSIADNPTDIFMKMHQALQVCRTVYVRRAWKNIAPGKTDTVMQASSVRIPPATTALNRNYYVAYLTDSTSIVTKYYKDTTWKTLSTGSISITAPVAAIRMANDLKNVYLAILTRTNKLSVYKSSNGTSNWVKVGDDITGATSISLTGNPISETPVIAYAKDYKPVFSYWNSSSNPQKWVDITISNEHSARDVSAIFTSSGLFFVTYTDSSYLYNTYYDIYNSDYLHKHGPKSFGKEMGNISLAVDETTLYLGYYNRTSVLGENGPSILKGELSYDGISGITKTNLQKSMTATNVRLAARNGKVYAIYDDRPRVPHCHAFTFDGTSWKPYGENQLPYFKGPFYDSHGYNLYGFAPEIAVTSDNLVFISMIAWEGPGGKGNNNGPIIMKNVSKNWTINTKP